MGLWNEPWVYRLHSFSSPGLLLGGAWVGWSFRMKSPILNLDDPAWRVEGLPPLVAICPGKYLCTVIGNGLCDWFMWLVYCMYLLMWVGVTWLYRQFPTDSSNVASFKSDCHIRCNSRRVRISSGFARCLPPQMVKSIGGSWRWVISIQVYWLSFNVCRWSIFIA